MKKVLLLLVLMSSLSLFGQNWTPVTSGSTDEIWGIDYVDANTIWICAKAGAVYKSIDGGTTWTAAGMTAQGAYSIAALSATTAVVATGPDAGNGGLYRTTNGGSTWTQVHTATGAWFNFIDNLDANTLWAQSDPISGLFYIVKSTDGGATWAVTPNRPTPVGTETGANGSFYRIGNTVWFGAGSGAHTYKSVNGPDGPWTMATTPTTSVGTLAFGTAAGSGICGYWNASTSFGKSTDGGATWANVTSVNWGTSTTMTNVIFINGTTFAFATTSNGTTNTNGGIWMTSNNGTTWTQDLTLTSGMNVIRAFGDINIGLAGGNSGKLYKSNRSPVTPVELTSFTASANNNIVTLNWSTATETNNKGFEVQKKSANSDFMTVGFVNGNGSTVSAQNYSFTETVQPGTYTYRLRQVDFNGNSEFSNAVEVEVVNPSLYTLGQNYPNPFNPSTKIDFSVAKSGMVRLAVYNLLGQQVQTLVNEVKEAGSYSVNFNASNLTTGVYFYKLETPEFSKTMKMILNK